MTSVPSGYGRIRLQVMWTRLIALVEEQAQTLLRTAFSPVVRECGDLSAGVFDASGRMLAQAVTGTPGHINTMARSISSFLRIFPLETMAEDDVFVTNDPWEGTGHLNDFVVVTPAFHRGKAVGLFACTGHMTDVGGIGLSPDATDLYMEGVLVPVMKLVDRGRLNETLIQILKASSRQPLELEGDLHAQMASNETGRRRLGELLDEVGADDLVELADHIVDTSRAAVVERLKALPRMEASHRMIVDGYEKPIELAARLRIEEERVSLDWSGSSPASRFGINVPLNYCAAYTCYALSCAIAPDVPNNHGSLSVFDVRAPEGSILCATRPMPVSCRHIVGLLLPDAVFGCFDQIAHGRVPAESCSAHWTLTFRGRGEAAPFIISIVTNGGMGARPALDGLSATSFPSAVRATPIEVVENATPLIFWNRELRAGSGGDGEARGGLGQEMRIGTRGEHPFTLFAAFDRIEHPALGRAGGRAGATGELFIEGGRKLAGKGAHDVAPNERLVIRTPGGAGYGEPAKRADRARAADAAAGYA